MYADDLVFVVPSSISLSMLLCTCSEYGVEHDIKYNSVKSDIIIFCCRRFKDMHYIYTFRTWWNIAKG